MSPKSVEILNVRWQKPLQGTSNRYNLLPHLKQKAALGPHIYVLWNILLKAHMDVHLLCWLQDTQIHSALTQVIFESVSECSNRCREFLYPCKGCHLSFRQWQQNTSTIYLQAFHGSSCILFLIVLHMLSLPPKTKQTFCFLLIESKNKLDLSFICREKRAMAKQVTFHIYILLKSIALTEKSLFL